MSARPNSRLGFAVASVGGQPAARFTCASCPATHEQRISGRLNPEMTAKRAERAGWRAEAFNRSVTRCPACIATRPPNDPDSEIKRRMHTMPTMQLPARVALGRAPSPAAAPAATVLPMPPKPAPAAPAAPAAPTAPTRAAIRALLDVHFDEAAGAYREDHTDESVAEWLGAPLVLVQQLREVAYGPLRVTPAMVQMRKELMALRSECEAAADAVQELAGKVKAATARLEAMVKPA